MPDKFKDINDKYGHEEGDSVLRQVANILQTSCRVEDTAVRLGGDEFLLVLPHCSRGEATRKAEAIRALVNQISIDNTHINVSASFGVASTEERIFDYKSLFNLADKAAYKAKKLGGNAVQPKIT